MRVFTFTGVDRWGHMQMLWGSMREMWENKFGKFESRLVRREKPGSSLRGCRWEMWGNILKRWGNIEAKPASMRGK